MFWRESIWSIGSGGTCAFPYGSVLRDVNLGDGFVVEDGDVGGQHSCFISTDKELKCFGRNQHGQLGYGDRDNRGDEKGEMGDNLLAVDLGTGFEPKQVASGAASNCVLSTLLEIKCFGYNNNGELGYGDTKTRGDTGGPDGEMGNNLNLVDLGDFTPIRVFAGAGSSCALSEEGTAKCWGSGKSGRLGMGNEDNVGDQAGEMGNNLPLMNFGTEFGSIMDMYCGRNQICGASDGGPKCYGSNYVAALGQGDRDNRGGTPETVGDNLPFIDLGADFDFANFAVGGTHAYHICAVSTEDKFKCWGHNKHGQLGLGTNQALMGDRASEMGDGLPYVDLPVNYPSGAPSIDPTVAPTSEQTTAEQGIQQNAQSNSRESIVSPMTVSTSNGAESAGFDVVSAMIGCAVGAVLMLLAVYVVIVVRRKRMSAKSDEEAIVKEQTEDQVQETPANVVAVVDTVIETEMQ